jgi:hypothetical protein
LLVAALLLVASVEPTDEVIAAADQAGVDPVELQGALNTTHLAPLEYLYQTGHLKRPVPKPTGRLACIAWVESRNDPNATNPRSKAAGLYQFLWSTWATTPQGRAGLSPYDPAAATEAAEWMVRQGRIREWVAVSGGYC